MDEQNAQTQPKQNKVTLKIKDEDRRGVYANAATVNVNRNEVVIDFGYIVPGVKPTTIDIVSRVNMGHNTAENFLKILQDSMLDYRNAVKKANS